MQLYGIIGAGGFGTEVMPIAREFLSQTLPRSDFELVFVEENPTGFREMNGHRVISLDEFKRDGTKTKRFNVAIADYEIRERLANHMLASDIPPFSICAPTSRCYDGNTIGEGAILCDFTIITSNARIGKFFHANIYSYVAHYCVIGDFVTFAPDVHCNGGVVVEDYAYIGTGAVLRQATPEKPLVIGKGARVGMGAVVTKSVPPFATVVGNPARAMETKFRR